MRSDLQVTPPDHGDLTGWARQGVLLLNTALTVPHRDEGAHAKIWKSFSDAVIEALNAGEENLVFILWGSHANERARLIDASRHGIVAAAHPTARATAKNPFLDSRSFSRANRLLGEAGRPPIDWAAI